MPNNQALQVFYGTVPLILIVVAVWLRESMLLKDILLRLSHLGESVAAMKDELSKIHERLEALEKRAGIIFHS